MNWPVDPSQEVYLRRLLPADVHRVVQLAGRAFADPSVEREIQRMLQTYCYSGANNIPIDKQEMTMLPVSYYVLARDDPDGEQRLGITGLYRPVWAGEGVFWLGWLAVDPQFQGQGYGARLLAATMELAAAKGGRLMCIETASDLEAALSLYYKMGFTQVGEVPDYFAPGGHMLILHRSLLDIRPSEELPGEI